MSKIVPTKPLLILLYGFPGSGKTSFAHQLTEHLQCAHVQGDRIRYELFEKPTYSKQENAIVAHLLEYMTEEFLSAGISVIYDENVSRLATRQILRNEARKRKAEPILIWLQTDADSAFMRLQRRDRRTTEDRYAPPFDPKAFDLAVSRMQNPQNEDYIVVSGKHTFLSQKNTVMRRLLELGLITTSQAPAGMAKPGLVNLVPQLRAGRVDHSRRNIIIR